jgi:hypothetical protein
MREDALQREHGTLEVLDGYVGFFEPEPRGA